MSAESASAKLLFDFATAFRSPAWQIVNDDVMGGVSRGRFEVLGDRAVFRGVVSLENNGGFVSVRSASVRRDLAGCDVFIVRIRGDGKRYKFTARMEPGFDSPIYQCAFKTKEGEWEEHWLACKDFIPTLRGRVLIDVSALNPAQVSSVGFLIADKQEGPFQLEIASVRAAARKPSAP